MRITSSYKRKLLKGGANTSPNMKRLSTGITLISTDLIGSNPEDIFHIEKINRFNNGNGLRAYQINKIFELWKKYSAQITTEPNIFCGDIGGILPMMLEENYRDAPSPIKVNTLLIENYKKKYPNQKTVITQEEINKYYTNGIDILTKKYGISNVKIYPLKLITTTPPPTTTPGTKTTADLSTDLIETNTESNIISSYVFTNGNIEKTLPIMTNSYRNTIILPPSPPLPPSSSPLYKYAFGTLLPLGVKIQIPGPTIIDIPIQPRIRKRLMKTIGTVKLYTREELTKIINMLDNLMSKFAYGYKAYLKRDLGCLSFDESSMYSKRPLMYMDNKLALLKYIDKKTTSDKITNKQAAIDKVNINNFYAMSFPSYVEVFLYEICGFYNTASTTTGTTSGSDAIFFNENQIHISSTDTRVQKMPIFEKIEQRLYPKQPPGTTISIEKSPIHILARILLIPSDHLKQLCKIDPRSEGIGATDYKTLYNTFCMKYYNDTAIIDLEERLATVFKNVNAANPKETKNFIEQLLETTVDKSSGKKSLKNLGNMSLIEALFEFLFIMLRIKYMDSQIDSLNTYNSVIDKTITIINKTEEYARDASGLTNNARALYNFKESAGTTNSESLMRIISSPNTKFENPKSAYESIDELIEKDKKYIDSPITIPDDTQNDITALQHMQAYIAYTLIKLIKDSYTIIKNIKVAPATTTAIATAPATATTRNLTPEQKTQLQTYYTLIQSNLNNIKKQLAKLKLPLTTEIAISVNKDCNVLLLMIENVIKNITKYIAEDTKKSSLSIKKIGGSFKRRTQKQMQSQVNNASLILKSHTKLNLQRKKSKKLISVFTPYKQTKHTKNALIM